MPIYEYDCQKCGERIEVMQKISDKPLKRCRSCGGKLEKVFSAPGIQFKGAGWYVTDYAGKKSDAKAGDGKSDAKETSDASRTDTATDKKQDSSNAAKSAATKKDNKPSGD